jgi:heme-degrading monooxygenase HmoA
MFATLTSHFAAHAPRRRCCYHRAMSAAQNDRRDGSAEPVEGAMVTVFRSRLDPAHLAEYGEIAEATEAGARASEGFVDFKTFVADDGERCSIVVFADRASHERWRSDPLHREAQRAGWDRLYERFEILACQLVRRTVHRACNGGAVAGEGAS